MKKIILTGASGFLGYHLMRIAAKDLEVYGIWNTKPINFTDAVQVNCDITNYIELGNIIDDIEPDATIHAAAISDSNFCQLNKELSYAVNVEATKNIAGICSDYSIPMAFTSTDLVFDGTQGMYTETDHKNPLNIYGEQKALAEEEVLRIYPNATVFRLPLMFGLREASERSYMQQFITQIKRGEKAKLFNDEYRSVCGACSISEGILKLMWHNSGIIHLAGPDRLSRYNFGKEVVKAFKLDETLLDSCSQKDVKMAAPRPADVSLDISKALSLGFAPLSVSNELNLIAEHKYLK